MGQLDGRVAFVTGAVSGIGRAIATHFAREGAAIGVVDLDQGRSAETAAELAELDVKSHGVAADVGDEGAVKRGFSTLVEALGDADILVNNAGTANFATVLEMTVEQWDEMIRINLRSMFLCSRQVLPAMLKKKWGRIINLSSQLAHKGAGLQAHYVASKGGRARLYPLPRARGRARGHHRQRAVPGERQYAPEQGAAEGVVRCLFRAAAPGPLRRGR